MYFITVMQGLITASSEGNKLIGFYYDYDKALDAVLKNEGNMAEDIYYYAMIQKFGEGLYQEPELTHLFMFDWTTREYFKVCCEDWEIPVVMG